MICYDYQSCYGANITNVQYIKVNGTDALGASNILSGDTDRLMEVRITGNNYQVYNLYCKDSDFCKIYCFSNDSCTNLYLHCHGKCCVYCDPSIGILCPTFIVGNYSQCEEPTSIPTMVPSAIPTVIPSNVNPTNVPSSLIFTSTTRNPTTTPTTSPTLAPTILLPPTSAPTSNPTGSPTGVPTESKNDDGTNSAVGFLKDSIDVIIAFLCGFVVSTCCCVFCFICVWKRRGKESKKRDVQDTETQMGAIVTSQQYVE